MSGTTDRDRQIRARADRLRFMVAGLWLAVLGGCDPVPRVGHAVPGGEPDRGANLIDRYGCGTCHLVPGIRAAEGMAGPPLSGWAGRDFIAGAVPNTPGNLIRWIMDPDAIEPGTAMPDLGVSESEARHIAAYLYTLP